MIAAEFDYAVAESVDDAIRAARPRAGRTPSSWPAGTRCCR